MNEGVLLIVLVILGPVVVALVEAAKLLAKTKLGEALTGDVKLKVALITAGVVGVIAAMLSGQVNIVGIISEVVVLIKNPPGPWEFLPALAAVFSEVAMAIGVVVAISQGVYAVLRERLKKSGWLAA